MSELAPTIRLLEDAYAGIKQELAAAGVLDDDGAGGADNANNNVPPTSASASASAPVAAAAAGWAWLQDEEALSVGAGGSAHWLQGVFARGGSRRDHPGRRAAFPKLMAVVDALLEDADHLPMGAIEISALKPGAHIVQHCGR